MEAEAEVLHDDVENVNPPPSDKSRHGEEKQDGRESGGPVQYTKNACSRIVDAIGFTGMVAIAVLPITMTVIGGLSIDSCPIERMIPIWLVVGGAVSTALQVRAIITRAEARCDIAQGNAQQRSKFYKFAGYLAGCFCLVWFIAGNVWVYRIYPPLNTEDFTSHGYCNHLTYYFSFWTINAVYIASALSCFVICCCAAALRKSDDQ